MCVSRLAGVGRALCASVWVTRAEPRQGARLRCRAEGVSAPLKKGAARQKPGREEGGGQTSLGHLI